MAKKSAATENVWLQCSDCGDLNYRTPVNMKGGMAEKLKAGLKKYCPRSRQHTLHKIKKK
ncbi:MAG: 50S ribosomal protein L33 [Phycisphaerae bacterium]|nr:50S ribosomal protein L33 [Phycisphaerae bacterium]